MSIIAFIPARGGSKSIKNKNIKPLHGQPLIVWTLRALEKVLAVDEIIVATDDESIANATNQLNIGKARVYNRSQENASDTASTESVMLEYIQSADLKPEDTFILVQATSPFTQPEDIMGGLELMEHYDSVLSCAKIKRFLWNKDGSPINYDPLQRPRRQDFDGTYMENGAFYINAVQNIIKHKNRLSGKVGVHEMAEYTSLELDEPEDWLIAEKLMHQHGISEKTDRVFPDIKLFLSDLDGVLTDSGMYYSENGDELKKFSTYDGMAFELLRNDGIKTGIITAEDRALNKRRADKLKLDYLFQGAKNKLEIVKDLCHSLNISLDNVAYIGDDINDIEVLKAAGASACPANSRESVKNISGIIQLQSKGGEGAVREFVELLLRK